MMRTLCLLICGACFAAGCQEKPSSTDDGPLVATNSGKVVGQYAKVLDKDVTAFLGIPFAKPPLGEKRFRKPEPVDPWDGVLLAHKKPPPCMQRSQHLRQKPSISPNEDCLYLNIWTPTKCCNDSEDKIPVLVWIYGGGFTMGSSDIDIYDGSVLASYGKVIVVSMNYRLGIFGFLNVGTDSAPGNAGIFDQVLALRWIKENIQHFGGDSNQITLFGESAGSISISMHLISPLSRNLFNKAILQSGTMYNPPMFDTAEVASRKAAEFAKLEGCGNDDVEEVVRCLKEMEATVLTDLENNLTLSTLIYFLPSIGNDFLPRSPIEAYDSGDLAQVDVLIGNTKDEGTLFLPYMLGEVFQLNQEPKLTLSQAKDVTRKLFHFMPKSILDRMVEYYFQNATEGSLKLAQKVAGVLGDYLFNCPTVFLAEKLDNVHMYWMTHRSLMTRRAEWLGVYHFAEVAFVFGVPIKDTEHFTPEDKLFSEEVIQKWVNFARKGRPMSDGDGTWRKFSKEDPVAWELSPSTAKLATFPRYEICNDIWRPLITAQTTIEWDLPVFLKDA